MILRKSATTNSPLTWFTALLFLLGAIDSLQAQPLGLSREDKTAGVIPGGILPKPGPDEAELRRQLRQAQAHVSSKDLRRAAEKYQFILEEFLEKGKDQDYFQPSEVEGETITSVRGDIDRWLAAMPPDVRTAYELRYGRKARNLVLEAVREGDGQLLERAYRLYFHTEAGQTAAFLLGEMYLDEGQSLRAALYLARLKQSSGAARFEPSLSFKLAVSQHRAQLPEDALATLSRLRREYPRATIRVGGRDVPLFADDRRALDWLVGILGEAGAADAAVQWLVFGGNPARSAASRGDEPVVVRWRVPATNNPDHVLLRDGQLDGGLVPELMRRFQQRNVVTLPSAHPLILRGAASRTGDDVQGGDLAIVRTLNSLLAIDLRTGKRFWQREEPEPSLNGQMPLYVETSSPFTPFVKYGAVAPTDTLEKRLWSEGVHGQLSSDGELVYVVVQHVDEERKATSSDDPEELAGLAGQIVRPTNILQAIALKANAGSVQWQLSGREPKDSPFAGAYFLGPPLPLGGTLYVLAEFSLDRADLNSGEVRLLALDPRALDARKRPKLLWSQKVALFDDSYLAPDNPFGFSVAGRLSARSLLRWQAGLSPSYADGVLVCPTGVGAVVAMDLTTRSLRWGYKYPTVQPNVLTPSARLQGSQAGNLGRWADSPIVIAAGRVLLTPPLAKELHCVALANGKKLWSVPRNEGLFVAGVHDGLTLVVGSRHVSAFPLNSSGTAKPAWEVELPPSSAPTGRGFFSSGQYYLPLSTAEIAVIDAAQGKIVRRLKSPEGRSLGNLICHNELIISQGPASVECFFQRKPLAESLVRSLGQKANDAAASLLAAKVALHDAKTDEALAHLRRSYQSKPDSHTHDLLVDTLLKTLRSDLVKHRGLLAELGKLVDDHKRRGEYLAVLARSFAQEGKPLEALDVLLELASVSPQERLLAGGSVSTRSDAMPSVTELYQSSSAAQRAELDRRLEARLQEAMAAPDAAALRQFIDLFAFHALADMARKELVLRGVADRGVRPVEADILLAQLERSSDAAAARWAVAQRTLLLAALARHADAAAVYRRLLEEFADEVCLDGLTGKQLVERLPAESPIRQLLKPVLAAWPQNKVVAEIKPRAPGGEPLYRVPLRGDEPWARQTLLYFKPAASTANPRAGTLLARDRLGQRLWEVELNLGTAARLHRDAWINTAAACRHLLVVYLGNEVVALDMLRPDGKPEILWRQALVDALPGLDNTSPFAARFEQMPWGELHRFATDQWTSKPLGRLGPVTARFVCFQRGEELVAVHPLTGRVLWTRRGVPPGCYLCGNEELVIAYSDRDVGFVLRASDGEVLAKPPLAAVRDIMTSVGSRIAVWEQKTDGNIVLRMVDAATKRSDELGQFAAGSKACLVEKEAVAVIQPDGHFMAFRLSDGKPEFDKPQKLKLKDRPGKIYARKWRGQYLVAVSRADQQREYSGWALTYGASSMYDPHRPLVSGMVFGVGGHGEPWSAAIDNLHWLLDQPSDFPVMVFSSGGAEFAGYGGKAVLSINCLDKRTGKTIFQERRGRAANTFDLSADESQQSVTLRYADVAVTLKFTEPPLEAPPPKK